MYGFQAMSRSNHESQQFMEQIRDLVAIEEIMHKKNKKNFIISSVLILFFAFTSCLCVYCIATNFNKESFIPVLLASLVFLLLSIYYSVVFGRKYYYRQRDGENARRDSARARVPLVPQNVQFEEESDSRSSPADLSDPAAEEPSNLPQTESSTLSEQASTTQESSEKTSLSGSTKGTFTTTAVIECASMAGTSSSTLPAAEEIIALASKDEDPKPSTSSQSDSIECLDDVEDETGKVRQRRLTPEGSK